MSKALGLEWDEPGTVWSLLVYYAYVCCFCQVHILGERSKSQFLLVENILSSTSY